MCIYPTNLNLDIIKLTKHCIMSVSTIYNTIMCNKQRILEIQILIEIILNYKLLKKSGKSTFSSAILLTEVTKINYFKLEN